MSIEKTTNTIQFPLVEKIIRDLKPGEFSILSGPAGVGKTTWLANIAHSLVNKNVSLFVFSIEADKHNFSRRVFSVETNEACDDWQNISTASKEKIKHWVYTSGRRTPFYSNNILEITDVQELMNDLVQAKENYDSKVAIIDNLSFLLKGNGLNATIQNVLISQLIELAKKLKIHLILVVYPKENYLQVNDLTQIAFPKKWIEKAQNIFLINRIDSSLIEKLKCSDSDRMLTIHRKGLISDIILTTQKCFRYDEQEFINYQRYQF